MEKLKKMIDKIAKSRKLKDRQLIYKITFNYLYYYFKLLSYISYKIYRLFRKINLFTENRHIHYQYKIIMVDSDD